MIDISTLVSEKDFRNQFDRLAVEKQIIEWYFERYRHILTNKTKPLTFELGGSTSDSSVDIIAINNMTGIKIYLGILDGGIIYTVDKFEKVFNQFKLNDTMRWNIVHHQVAFTILHEMTHDIQQTVPELLCTYLPYYNIMEHTADMNAIDILTKEEANPSILDFVYKMATNYQKGFIPVNRNLSYDIGEYYLQHFKEGLQQFFTESSGEYYRIQVLLFEPNTILIRNYTNNLHDEFYIKLDGKFIEPGIEYTRLANTFNQFIYGQNQSACCLCVDTLEDENDFSKIVFEFTTDSPNYLKPLESTNTRDNSHVSPLVNLD